MSRFREQLRSTIAISKYSLLATLRSPTSVVFALLFPIIFIVVFGSIIGDQAPTLKIAIAKGSDTTGPVYKAIRLIKVIKIQPYATMEDLQKGRVLAIVNIRADGKQSFVPHYTVHISAANASGGNLSLLETTLNEVVRKIDAKAFPSNPSVASLVVSKLPGRVYRTIDFILPGQLGFSLLMAGVYGSSFLLFYLRQNLVLKRLRATPVKRTSIIAGEMLSRLFFHIISFVLIVALGYFAFGFTLVNGLLTFCEMLVYSLFGVFIFMGIGFIISGIVQNENAIAPIANTVVLPQILLCGLFFTVENYPHWMQQFCNLLPLSLFVDGLRKIAFEGSHTWQLLPNIGGLIAWTLIIGLLAIKCFKWE